jgi:hypothetical protein
VKVADEDVLPYRPWACRSIGDFVTAGHDKVVTGFNFVHPLSFSVVDQDDTLAHMKSTGVRVIRSGFWEDVDKTVDFIKRAYAQGIGTVLIFHGKYTPDAPMRPYRPTEFPGMWAGRRCRPSTRRFRGNISSS